jgi:hypothetical protein
MMDDTMQGTMLRPRMPIRRFDVFAEYQRLKGLQQGMDEAHAEGYGVWVAKVVASGQGRRTGVSSPHSGAPAASAQTRKEPTEQEWHLLAGEPQTDAVFEREVIQRMGSDFYRQVFEPAIAEAFRQGNSYEAIRDVIRQRWTPRR